MEIFILAAGMGSRLYPLTADRPKNLLTLNGRTILDWQLLSLQEAGFSLSNVTVIGGYRIDALRSALPDGIRIIENRFYETLNNIYTITLASPGETDVVLINGDCVCHQEFYTTLFQTQVTDFLLIDHLKPLTDEAMKAWYRDQRLYRLSKQWAVDAPYGEYVGMARFSRAVFERIRTVAEKLIAQGRGGDWYESAIEAVAQEVEIGAMALGEYPWIEVDNNDDLQAARQLMPRLY